MADEDTGALASPDEAGFIQEPSLEIFSSEEIKQDLITYLQKEVGEVATNSGRSDLIDDVKEIRRQRLAKPKEKTKDFPWVGASNVVPPMVLQKTNAVATKMMSTLLEKTPLFTYETDDTRYSKHADAVTRHVQKLLESPYGINFYKGLWPIIYDATSLGTKFLKVPFEVERMKFTKSTESGTEEVDRITKAAPSVKPIAFEDFLTRPEWNDIQKAPWVGVRYYKFLHELKALQQQGHYQNVELITGETGKLSDEQEDNLSNVGVKPTGATDEHNYIYEIYEINVFWDADGDGFDEDIIVHFEKNSGTILRAEPNMLGIRDYVRLPYIEIPDNLYGLGVGGMLAGLQDEAEALHNMRNDSIMLRLNPPLVVSASSDMGDDKSVYPGKIWETADPTQDAQWFPAPDVGGSSVQAEMLTEAYADKATGASQALSGGDVGGSNRIGATGTQTLLAQSTGFLDSIAVQLAHRLPEIAMLILFQLVKNGDIVKGELEGYNEADKILLDEVYSFGVEDIPSKFKFQARLSAVIDSKDAKQQAAMGIFQLYVMYGDKMSQISAQMADPALQQAPEMIEMLQTYVVGLTTLMENILKAYDEDNVGDYLPFVEHFKTMLQQNDTLRQQEVDQVEARNSEAANSQTSQGLPVDDGTGGAGGAVPSTGAESAGVQGPAQSAEGGVQIGG